MIRQFKDGMAEDAAPEPSAFDSDRDPIHGDTAAPLPSDLADTAPRSFAPDANYRPAHRPNGGDPTAQRRAVLAVSIAVALVILGLVAAITFARV